MMMKKALSFDEQSRILTVLSCLADDTEGYSAQLQRKGFTSFLAWQNFEKFFCLPEEYLEHKLCLLAQIKRDFSAPSVLHGDEKYVHNPCTARLQLEERENPSLVEKRRGEMYRDFLVHREREVRAIRVNGCDGKADVYFGPTLKRHLCSAFESCGYTYDGFRSSENFPVIAKHLVGHWDICWSLETGRPLPKYIRSPAKTIFEMPVLDLLCYVRARGIKGRVMIPFRFTSHNIMRIAVQSLVPGFSWAYCRYDGSEGIGLIISAHAELYGIVGQKIESFLVAQLVN